MSDIEFIASNGYHVNVDSTGLSVNGLALADYEVDALREYLLSLGNADAWQHRSIRRCDFRWTPEPYDGACYPEVQCTHRADVEHPHLWSSYEEDLWRRGDRSE